MTTARWSFSWRFGRRPRSDPGAPPVPRYYRYTCTRCEWISDEVDRYRGPATRSKAVYATLEDHLSTRHR
jgi:hypothetical protein